MNPLRQAAPASPVKTTGTAVTSQSQAFRFDTMETLVADLMGARLGIAGATVDVNKGYYELGLDSARLLELVQAIETALSVSLAPTLLFEYTTISSLAAHLTETCGLPSSSGSVRNIPLDGKKSVIKPLKAGIRKSANTTHAPLAGIPRLAPQTAQVQDIAVIGMAGCYPP